MPQRLLARDPICTPWRAHLRAHPVPRGQQVLLARTALAHGTGAASSPCFAALLRDLERASLQAAPAVRRVYSQATGALLAEIAGLGYAPIPGAAPVKLDSGAYVPIVCDLGPESVAGWLSALAARDLAVSATAVLDEDARELVVDGRRVALSALECDVLRYLREREGQAVARSALLRDVWGYAWTGGSNVVDVAISGLRRKLGDRAGTLETVRGVGYRLRTL